MRFFIILICILVPAFSFGQTEYLLLDHSCTNPPSVILKQMVCIDNRAENQILGFVHRGMSNKPIEVKYNGNLPDSLTHFFAPLSSSRDLVVILNEFTVWEYKDQSGEYGRFKLSVRFFEQVENRQYQELMTHDSLYIFKGIDVTKKLLRGVSSTLCNLAAMAQTQLSEKRDLEQSDAKYSLEELRSLDKIEKTNIPFYAIEVPRAGIYASYKDLSKNQPSIPCEVVIDDSNPKKLKISRLSSKGKKVNIPNQDIYAVSDGVRFYRSQSMGFFQIVKENNDFYYARPQIYGASSGAFIPIMGPGVLGGAIGGAVIGLTSSLLYKNKGPMLLYKINHRKGNGIPISRIEDQAK